MIGSFLLQEDPHVFTPNLLWASARVRWFFGTTVQSFERNGLSLVHQTLSGTGA
jgi:hypothetical protein